MFKRLAKSKRHSIEGLVTDPRVPGTAAGSLSPGFLSASQTAGVDTVSQDLTNSNLGNGRAPRAKQARRSCGDQPLTRSVVKANDQQRRNEELEDENEEEEDDDDEHRLRLPTRVNSTETDYQMVTAVPAYIVEHEPEKQKGTTASKDRVSRELRIYYTLRSIYILQIFYLPPTAATLVVILGHSIFNSI